MPQDKLDQVRERYEAAGMTPEEAPDLELREHNVDISDFDEMVENYAQGGGWYELPGGNKVQGKKSALAVLRAHLEGEEDGPPQYVCVQHPEMTVYGPQGKLGQFVGGKFEPNSGIDLEDEKVQEVLDDTPYVMREN